MNGKKVNQADQQGLNLFGQRRVFNPRGHLVAEMGEHTKITYLHDRKPHLYHSVVEPR